MDTDQRDQVRGQRRVVAAQLAQELPHPSPAEINDHWDLWQIPPIEATQILPGLFQGGTDDDDVIYFGRQDRYSDHVPYHVIITLYASAQPAPWGVEEYRYGFEDGELHGADLTRVLRAALLAYQRWTDGDDVLVRCQAGINRSGLVTALVLIQAGLSAAQAITLIRRQRGAGTLLNDSFVGWLLQYGEQAVEQLRLDLPSAPDPLAA